MTGKFTITTTGPSDRPPTTTGKSITIVADASSGQVLDFFLCEQAQPALPRAEIVFQRDSATSGRPAASASANNQ
jgi:hypothetical protein